MRHVFALPCIRQQSRSFNTVVQRPQLGLHQRIGHTLYPLRPALDIVRMRHRHAAGMVAPDIAGKAQHLAHALVLGHGIEGLGHDETGNVLRRQRRHHVGRRHHDQAHLTRARRVALRHFQPVAAQQILQHHVVDGVPERNRHRLAAQFGHAVDARLHGQRRARHVVPHQHLQRRLAAIARPHRHRRQHMHHVHLPADEGFHQLRPAAEQHRLFHHHALGLEQLAAVRHQQRRGIGDRQIADAQRRIRLHGMALATGLQQWQAAGAGKQRRQFHPFTSVHAGSPQITYSTVSSC